MDGQGGATGPGFTSQGLIVYRVYGTSAQVDGGVPVCLSWAFFISLPSVGSLVQNDAHAHMTLKSDHLLCFSGRVIAIAVTISFRTARILRPRILKWCCAHLTVANFR